MRRTLWLLLVLGGCAGPLEPSPVRPAQSELVTADTPPPALLSAPAPPQARVAPNLDAACPPVDPKYAGRALAVLSRLRGAIRENDRVEFAFIVRGRRNFVGGMLQRRRPHGGVSLDFVLPPGALDFPTAPMMGEAFWEAARVLGFTSTIVLNNRVVTGCRPRTGSIEGRIILAWAGPRG